MGFSNYSRKNFKGYFCNNSDSYNLTLSLLRPTETFSKSFIFPIMDETFNTDLGLQKGKHTSLNNLVLSRLI